MKYTPPNNFDEEKINVTNVSPLKEVLILFGASVAIILMIYILLGLSVDIVAERLPFEIEKSIGKIFDDSFEGVAKRGEAETKLQKIVDDLSKIENGKIKFKVEIKDEDTVNAMALPGGKIIVFSKLIEMAESENEITFVLAHELGHYKNRDHLKAIGRNLVFLVMSVALFGNNNPVTGFLSNSVSKAEMKFSQNQEKSADLYALQLLNKKYGHVNGAIDFFYRISKTETKSKLSYYFASHPHPEIRIKLLNDEIKLKHYKIKDKTKLEIKL